MDRRTINRIISVMLAAFLVLSPTSGLVYGLTETTGDNEASQVLEAEAESVAVDDEQAADPEPDSIDEVAKIREQGDTGSDDNDDAADSDGSNEEGASDGDTARESEKPDARSVKQYVRAGKATVSAEYTSDIFSEDATLTVREIKCNSREFAEAENAAASLLGSDRTTALLAYDITFVTSSGEEIEPSGDVKISIITDENMPEISSGGLPALYI